jgi:hypothetical protein
MPMETPLDRLHLRYEENVAFYIEFEVLTAVAMESFIF